MVHKWQKNFEHTYIRFLWIDLVIEILFERRLQEFYIVSEV